MIREATKQQFAEALKKLVKIKDFQKIRVIELCKYCGTERQTFYYHFKDKYDLAAWIFLKDMERSVRETDNLLCEAQLACLLHYLDRERAFYRKVFLEASQNALNQYVYQYNVSNTESMLQKLYGEQILDDDMRFAIRYHASAWVSCMAQFVMGELNFTPEALAAHIYSNVPSPLSDVMQGALLFDV